MKPFAILFVWALTALIMSIASPESWPTVPKPEPFESTAESWTLLSDDVTATVYNAVPSQCNDDPVHTASMFRLDLDNVESHRIIAMERTMMAEYGISYGDTVLVAGTGRYDGLWQVQDTMNKRFKGQHKIDFLVPKHIRHGKWQNIKVYKKNIQQI